MVQDLVENGSTSLAFSTQYPNFFFVARFKPLTFICLTYTSRVALLPIDKSPRILIVHSLSRPRTNNQIQHNNYDQNWNSYSTFWPVNKTTLFLSFDYISFHKTPYGSIKWNLISEISNKCLHNLLLSENDRYEIHDGERISITRRIYQITRQGIIINYSFSEFQ